MKRKKLLFSLVALLLPLTTWAQEKLTPTYKESVVYAGDNTKAAAEISLEAGGTKLVEFTDYYLSFTVGEEDTPAEELRNVGTYTVKVNFMKPSLSQAYTCDDFTVTVKPLDVSSTGIITPEIGKTVELEYGDELDLEDFITVDKSKLATASNVDKEYANFLGGLQLVAVGKDAGEDLTEIGTYSVAVNGIEENNPSNYIYKRDENGTTVKLIVNKKLLYMTLKGKVYNTGAINLTYLGNKDKGQYTLFKDSEKKTEMTGLNETITFTYDPKDNENVKNESGLNAGTYYLRAEITDDNDAKAHYTLGDDTFEYEISKANLAITKNDNATLSKTYGEKDPDLTAQFTYTREGSDTPGTLTVEQVKVLNLTMERVEGENVYAADGKTPAKYAISPKVKNDAELANYEIVYNYNGTGNTNKEESVFTINAKSLNKDGNGTPTDGIVLTQPEDKTVTYAAKDFVQNPDEVEGLSLTDNGLKITTLNKNLVLGTDYKLVFGASPNNETQYVAKNAGDVFNISLVGLGNYKGEVYSLNYEIKKANLKITPKEDAIFSKVYDNEGSGDLSMTHFDYEGLLEVDAEGNPTTAGVLELKVWESTVGPHYSVHLYNGKGEYVGVADYKSEDITKGLKNYIVDYTLQYFDILKGDLVLDASADANAESGIEGNVLDGVTSYNGLEVSKVTVKNLRARDDKSFTGEKWYTVVLPFETSVRELSAAFGYAIVNIPDENNTDPNLAKFKFTMGEIPANTLIVFKVDDADIIGSEDEITFENKKIVMATDDDWATIANTKYWGVYEDRPTLDLGNEYWIHTNGQYYNGSVTLHPLSGYIEYLETPSAPQLSLEYPDGSTTVINAITMETVNSVDGWYTVGGVKLNGAPTQKGIYINNGKKVVIK